MDNKSSTRVAKLADARHTQTERSPDRPGAARRRRARRLPGRRLSRAARARHRAGLDHRHLDRRDQCQPDRRQSARKSPRSTKGILDPNGVSAAVRRPGLDRIAGHDCLLEDAASRHSGFLRAQPRRVPRHSRSAGRRRSRLLLHRTAGKDAARTGRLFTGQQMQAAAHRRRRPCAHQRDALFRQPRRRDRRQAHHGIGRVAACLSGECASTASSTGTAAFSPTRRPR